jgi:tetratricopeptide (TPR) repeat protein
MPLLWAGLILGGWLLPGLGADPAAPTTADRLAAQSLAHQAISLGHLRTVSPDRTGRMQALLEMARSLDPSDGLVNRQLAELDQALAKPRLATQAAQDYLQGSAQDYGFSLSALMLGLGLREEASARQEFLKALAADSRRLSETRAAALAMLAEISLRQGDDAAARQAVASALQLDKYNLQALTLRLRQTSRPTTRQSEQSLLEGLGGQPRNLDLLWDLAQMLQDAGLSQQALGVYQDILHLRAGKYPGLPLSPALLVDYANVLLDLDKPADLAEQLPRLMEAYRGNVPLLALLQEAHEALGQKDKAADDVEKIARAYIQAASSPSAAADAMEMAWFELHFRNQPAKALELARQVMDRSAKQPPTPSAVEPFALRVAGAAELAAGDAQKGRAYLAGLVGRDAYAAAILARYENDHGNAQAARTVVQSCQAAIHSGPGWRNLRKLAGEIAVQLPPLDYAAALDQEFQAAGPRVIELGMHPEKFLRLSATAPAQAALGEPIEMRVELANISDTPVPLGPDGAMALTGFVSLTVEGPARVDLADLTACVLPAPKYLQPGQKVAQTVRLDVGSAEQLFMAEPLADLKLTAVLVVDPVSYNGRNISSVPQLALTPVVISHPAFVPAGSNKQAVQRALAMILNDQRNGDLPAQMRAARQTAALLNFVRQVQAGKAAPLYPDVLTEGVLAALAGRFLQSPQAAVRAQMLAGLGFVPLDSTLAELVKPFLKDGSPLVRMQALSLMGSQKLAGFQAALDAAAKDPNLCVRQMAQALGGK